MSNTSLSDGDLTLRSLGAGDAQTLRFTVEHDDQPVGEVVIQDHGGGVGELWWSVGEQYRGRGVATRAVGLLTAYGFEQLGLRRVEARVNPANRAALTVASRNGLRREGVVRGPHEQADASGHVLMARLADDPSHRSPEGFRAVLNAGLPRKRAIAQMLLRDGQDRVLLCRLTYKRDWDLPGGVVEVGESPRLAVCRELAEELSLTIDPGELLLTDWLPAWGGWDDALCLVFDGGVREPALLVGATFQEREIRDAQFCTMQQVWERCADFTARRVEAALARTRADGTAYAESGRP